MTLTGRPLMVGQLAPMAYRFGTEEGAALAVDEINRTGGVLGGRQLTLELRDDQANSAEAVRQFNELADLGVAAIVGSSDSNSSLALAPHIDARKIPYVSTSAADGQVDPVRPFLFMTPPRAGAAAEHLLHYMRDAGFNDVALAFDSDSRYAAAGLARHQSMAENFGIRMHDPVAFDRSTTDFEAVASELTSLRAKAVMVWATGPTTVGLTRKLHEQHLDVPLILCPGAATPKFFEVGKAGEGVIVASSLALLGEQLPNSRIRASAIRFRDAYVAQFGSEPSTFAVDGYIATRLIADAMERAGHDGPQQIRDALESGKATTAQGRYQFADNDHAGLDPEHLAVTVVRDGQFRITDWSYQRLSSSMDAAPGLDEST